MKLKLFAVVTVWARPVRVHGPGPLTRPQAAEAPHCRSEAPLVDERLSINPVAVHDVATIGR